MFKIENNQRRLLEEELEAVGIRLNKQKPKIYYKPRKTGGLAINSMVPLTKIDEKLVHSILAEYSTFVFLCLNLVFFYFFLKRIIF